MMKLPVDVFVCRTILVLGMVKALTMMLELW
jgi:hypothetical protein